MYKKPTIIKNLIPLLTFIIWFFDPSNTWYTFDNEQLKQSIEKFVKFPNSTSFENNEPRLLLVAIDIQKGVPFVFDIYEKQ